MGKTMPQLVWFGTSFSLWRPSLNPTLVYLRFVVDEIAMGQIFLIVLQVSPVSIIPPLVHIHIHSSTTMLHSQNRDRVTK